MPTTPTHDSPDPRRSLLRRLGYSQLVHDSHVPFMSHLVGTARLLRSWGERPSLCDAGLFHSVYGTEYFEPDAPADRDEVREVIGEDAEAIAWVWCAIRRDTIDLSDSPPTAEQRAGGSIRLSEQMAADIATLWAADTVEQIGRMAPSERGFADGLDRVLHLAGRPARAAVDRSLGELDAG